MSTTTMTRADACVRTEAGKAEIRAHALPLSRPARNLLMVIDASCPADEWIARVHGSTMADLVALRAAGLVTTTPAGARRTVHQRVTVEQAIRDWTYDALYTLLTQEARDRLGLIKGYRFILKIEGSTNAEALQGVALEFAEALRRSHGEETAARFRRQLGATE